MSQKEANIVFGACIAEKEALDSLLWGPTQHAWLSLPHLQTQKKSRAVNKYVHACVQSSVITTKTWRQCECPQWVSSWTKCAAHIFMCVSLFSLRNKGNPATGNNGNPPGGHCAKWEDRPWKAKHWKSCSHDSRIHRSKGYSHVTRGWGVGPQEVMLCVKLQFYWLS